MNVKRSLILVLAAASFGLTACGSLPSASTASLNGADTGNLSTLSLDGSAATGTADRGPGGPGGKGHGGPGGHRMGPGGPGGFGFTDPRILASLNLTDAQKTQIEALQTEAKAFFEANKPAAPASGDKAQSQADREAAGEAARAAFETAFKSDSFDPSVLNANRPEPPAPSEAMVDFQVDQMIKLHDILTAEQRAQLAKGPEQANATRPEPPADAADRETQRLDQLATGLSLSDEQKAQIKALFDAEASSRQSEMDSRRTAMEAERTALSDLLTADSVDRTALKTLLQSRMAKKPDADDHLQQLVKIHDILTADQRAKFLTLAGPGGPGGHEGFGGGRGPGGPGGHEGFGGHGGPGFGGPGGPAMDQAPVAEVTSL